MADREDPVEYIFILTREDRGIEVNESVICWARLSTNALCMIKDMRRYLAGMHPAQKATLAMVPTSYKDRRPTALIWTTDSYVTGGSRGAASYYVLHRYPAMKLIEEDLTKDEEA